MITSLDAATNSFLNHLSRIQDNISRTSAQISSGYRIQQPSDSPDQISTLLDLQANLSHNQGVTTTLARVQAEVQSADSGVSTALQLLDQARSLGAQGGTATTTAANRTDLSQRVQALQEQLVAISNTEVGGRYIYSGDQDGSAPYAVNLNQLPTVPQNGVDRLLTAPVTATRRIELSNHITAAVDQTGQDLFDHRKPDDSLAPDNVFAALNSLRVALASNVTADITAAQTAIETTTAYLNSKQGFYGAAENRISGAITDLNMQNTTLQQQISAIRDTDVVQAALQLTSASTQQQAALAAQAKIPRTTLFDYFG